MCNLLYETDFIDKLKGAIFSLPALYLLSLWNYSALSPFLHLTHAKVFFGLTLSLLNFYIQKFTEFHRNQTLHEKYILIDLQLSLCLISPLVLLPFLNTWSEYSDYASTWESSPYVTSRNGWFRLGQIIKSLNQTSLRLCTDCRTHAFHLNFVIMFRFLRLS